MDRFGLRPPEKQGQRAQYKARPGPARSQVKSSSSSVRSEIPTRRGSLQNERVLLGSWVVGLVYLGPRSPATNVLAPWPILLLALHSSIRLRRLASYIRARRRSVAQPPAKKHRSELVSHPISLDRICVPNSSFFELALDEGPCMVEGVKNFVEIF